MSTRQGVIGLGLAAWMVCGAACVSTFGSADGQGARLSDNFVVYAPFDNERDWGPSYLVGAPNQPLGQEARIDDTQSIPANGPTAPTDPNRPPLTSAPDQTAPPRPLP